MTQAQPGTVEEQRKLTEDIAKGHEADLVSSLLTEQLDRRRQAIEKQVFQILEQSDATLDPAKAVQAWLELHAIHRLEQGLRRRVQAGVSRA